MSRHVPFKKVDLVRAITAATAGGMEVARVEIDPVSGKIVLVAADKGNVPQNDLDKWMVSRAR